MLQPSPQAARKLWIFYLDLILREEEGVICSNPPPLAARKSVYGLPRSDTEGGGGGEMLQPSPRAARKLWMTVSTTCSMLLS